MKKVVIYPGRFQPMLSHHAKVFHGLQQEFPGAEVYIGTSDKVDPPKSPFSFVEKQNIAKALGIDDQRVLEAQRPYHKDDYTQYFDEDETVIFFAVGEKDQMTRFPMNNKDQETGLDMRVRGEPGPKYYQMINTYKQDPKAMSERGYITVAPSIVVDDEVASASAFRQALLDSPDRESAKEVFNKQFANYDEDVFNLIYDKIIGAKMTEELNIIRKLAGMDISEDAPVQFDTEVDPSKVKFMDPGKNSAKLSIANRFPEGSDVNDPEVKQEEFIKALIKSPAALLSEINERLDPKDENTLAVGEKLNTILDGMNSYDAPNVGNLPDEEKKFVISLVKVAIKDMTLEAGDDSDPLYTDDEEGSKDLEKLQHPDDYELEGVDLSDIRKDYNVQEDDVEEGRVKDMAMDLVDVFYDNVSELVDQNNDIEQSIIQAWNDSDETPPEYMLDDETQEILINAGLIEPQPEEPADADLEPAEAVEEGFMPEEMTGLVDYMFTGDDGEELDGQVEYRATIDQSEEAGYTVQVDPNSLQAVIDELSSQNMLAKISPDYADEMIQPGGEEHEQALAAAQEDADEELANADIGPYDHGEGPAESVDPELERIKKLAGIEKVDETEYWDWDDPTKPGYDEKEGYNANFGKWRSEAKASRSQWGDPDFESEEQMHQMFQKMMQNKGIDVQQQKKLSAKLEAEAKAADTEYWQNELANSPIATQQ